jgi:hypothetical protein
MNAEVKTPAMSIPENIHPACLLAAAFGFNFPKNLENLDRSELLASIADFLKIPVIKLEEGIAWFNVQGAEYLEQFIKDPDWIHDVPELMEKWLPVLFGKLEGLLADNQAGSLRSKIESFVARNQIPMNDLHALLLVSIVRQGEYLVRDGFQNSVYKRVRQFCTVLALQDSARYRLLSRQVASQFPTNSPFALNASGPSRLHTLAHLNESNRLAGEGLFRQSSYRAISALKSAFEGPIHDVVSFIWRLAYPPKTNTDNFPRDRNGFPIKGKIFKEARDWCTKNGISFPFDSVLDGYRVEKDGTVQFFSGSTQLASMSHADLTYKVNWEVNFAQVLLQSLWIGDMAIRNQRGEFDEAWDRAKSRIPDLEARVLVDEDEE